MNRQTASCAVHDDETVAARRVEGARRRVERLSTEMAAACHAARDAQERFRRLSAEAADAEIELCRLEARRPGRPASSTRAGGEVGSRVSDHALIRFLERRFGIDFEPVRRAILTPEREKLIDTGALRILSDGMELVLRRGVVTTLVMKASPPKARRDRPRRERRARWTEEELVDG